MNAADIVWHIRRMTQRLRGGAGQQRPPALELDDLRGDPQGAPSEEVAAPRQTGWWVLAQGGVLDPEDFGARETAREELLDEVRRAGVLVGENVWVWDETGRAQLVLSTLPTQERAWRVAERLRQKGLTVAVRREMA